MMMPVWERRNYIQQLITEVEDERKEIEKNNNKKASGSGKRTRRVST
jgi:hypothetical protein